MFTYYSLRFGNGFRLIAGGISTASVVAGQLMPSVLYNFSLLAKNSVF